jgi:WD40 repeat protein
MRAHLHLPALIVLAWAGVYSPATTAERNGEDKEKITPELSLPAGDAINIKEFHKITFSPDGKRIAATGQHGVVWVWNAKTGEQAFAIASGSFHVADVAFSRDGKYLAPSGGRRLKLWDAQTGLMTDFRQTPVEGSFEVAFSPDSRCIASATKDIKVWDIETGKVLLVIRGHSALVTGLSYRQDGKRIASGDQKGTVKVWETPTGKELFSVRQSDSIDALSYSPDGRWIAVAGHEQGIVLRDGDTGKQLLRLAGNRCVAFSPDGRQIASAVTRPNDKEGIAIWDAAGNELIIIEGVEDITSLAFSPDGEQLASVGYDALVQIWAVGRFLKQKANKPVIKLAQRRPVIVAQKKGVGAVGKVAVARAKRKPLFVLGGQTTEDRWMQFNRIKFNPDGTRIAATAMEDKAMVWDATTGKEVFSLKAAVKSQPQTGGVLDVGFSPDGQHLATAHGDKTVRLWDARTGRPGLVVRGLAETPFCLAFRSDSQQLASGDKDGDITLWEATTGRKVRSLQAHVDAVTALAYSPDGRRLASAGSDGAVKVWDVTLGRRVLALRYREAFSAVSFSRDGRQLAGAGGDPEMIFLWDAITGKELQRLPGSTCLALSPDGRRIASTGYEGTDGDIRIWDISTGRMVLAIADDGATTDLAFSPDGKRLAATTNDYVVKVWDVSDLLGRKLPK